VKKYRWHLMLLAALAVFAVAVLLWPCFRELVEPDERPDDGLAKSMDLQGDLRLMWRTRRLERTAAEGTVRRASTPRAINATSRVFNTVPLVGLTAEEVIAQLGDPRRSSDSVYNFPFYPAPPGVMVYRFDTGSWGWQFNLHFDVLGKVQKVERLGIE
jgi:hypothetical protein